MKPLKTAAEIRDAIRREAAGSTGWPAGADILVWPDGNSWKISFHSVNPARDQQLAFRAEGLAQYMRDRIDLAPTPLVNP